MITLFQPYYYAPTDTRRKENERCLRANIELLAITKIVLVIDDGSELPCTDAKIKVIRFEKRPTYNDFFELMQTHGGEYNVLANTDMYFDSTIKKIQAMRANQCYALTRYEPVFGSWVLYPHHQCSQDTWVFKGAPKGINGDFGNGRPGCDNRIAAEIEKAGYQVSNPALSIKTYHVHQSNERFYTRSETVPEPYKLVPATAL